MAINLNKNREDLQKAWKDVLDDKTETDWALFGYEAQTNELKVVGTGSQGVEELVEDLNSGKIMYAFVKVNDPKTSLHKCVLINWQGEGANTVRKGICANHLRDVENFFHGANVTINARNEDEVDESIIIDKVSKAGSAYSFKAPRSDNSGPKVAIGSNYKRVNPVQEINARERDQFWLKEELEEKKRVDEERKRKDFEKVALEEEGKKREAVEALKRDEKTQMRDNSIDLIKEAEKMAYNKNQILEKELIIDENDEINSSELVRKERNQEAQSLIAQRTIDARSIFERNQSAGQIKRTPEKPVRTSILKAQAQAQKIIEEVIIKAEPPTPVISIALEENEIIDPPAVFENKLADEPSDDDESDQFATIKRSPKDLEKKNSVTSPLMENHEETIQNTLLNNKQQDLVTKIEKVPVHQITEQQFVDEVLYGEMLGDSGIRAKALYDYQAADDTEITFDPGDLITHIELVDEGWWQGLGPDGSYGLFPANYVELI